MESQHLSQTVRKPWGGKLDAVREVPRAKSSGRQYGAISRFLRKLCELLLMSVLVAVPFMYYFSLPASWLMALREKFVAWRLGSFWDTQIFQYLGGMMPVLESKFSAWFISGMLLLAAYACARAFEGICGGTVFPLVHGEAADHRGRRRKRLLLLTICAFLGWSLASILFWPPDMPPEAAAITGRMNPTRPVVTEGLGAWAAAGAWMDHYAAIAAKKLGGGGMLYSVTAWAQVAFALVFFLVAQDVIRTRLLVSKIVGLIVIVGVINALLVVAQKLELRPLMEVWVRFAEDNTRNRLGAFIGHNTGVSSFLMPAFLFLLTLVISVQPRHPRRTNMVVGGSLVLMVLVLLLAQSRAVIPILTACSLGLAAVLYIQSSLRARAWSYAWLPVALVVVLATQFIPSHYNPLYREDVTLAERLGELTPDHLLSETRLRIAAVSMSQLFPAAPLQGHGFGSFQYAYPQAQGEYYAKYPRSVIKPTDRRTMRAHNEYLQVLVETGLVGLGMVLFGLWLFFRDGWDVLQRTLMPHHIAIQSAVLFSIIALLLHAAADFPLRVPPIAAMLVVLMAVWSAGERLWVFPIRAPRPEAEVSDALATGEPPRRGFTVGGIRVAVVGWLVLSMFVGSAMALLNASTVARFQSTKVLENYAAQLLVQYSQGPGDRALAERIGTSLRELRRISWLSGQGNYIAAQAAINSAIVSFRDADRARREDRLGEASRLRGTGLSFALAALSDLNQTLAEERYHTVFQSRSDVHRLIADNTLDEDRQRHHALSVEDLYRASSMNPGDPNILLDLVEELRPQPQANRGELVRIVGLLAWFHPTYFQQGVLVRVNDALAFEEVREAQLWIEIAREAAPQRADLGVPWALVLLRLGRTSEAMDAASEMVRAAEGTRKAEAEEVAQMIRLYASLLRENFSFALQAVRRAERSQLVPRSLQRSLLLFTLQRLGPDERTEETVREMEDAHRELLRMAGEDEQVYQVAAMTAFTWFGDIDASIEWMERRRAVPAPAPPLDLQGTIILAKCLALNGEWQRVLPLLGPMRQLGDRPYPRSIARFIADSLEARANAVLTTQEPAP